MKLDFIYDQKFRLALLYLPQLFYDMTDPRKCQLATVQTSYPSSSTVSIDSLYSPLNLILPQTLALFKHRRTCVNSLLHLLVKLSKFMSRVDLNKRILPIVVHVLNVVDLNETLGIDLGRDDDDETASARVNFCKLFDYPFMNELRIVFGLRVFLTQICPFLIEAISGFKDFEYESSHLQQHNKNLDSESIHTKKSFDHINQG